MWIYCEKCSIHSLMSEKKIAFFVQFQTWWNESNNHTQCSMAWYGIITYHIVTFERIAMKWIETVVKRFSDWLEIWRVMRFNFFDASRFLRWMAVSVNARLNYSRILCPCPKLIRKISHTLSSYDWVVMICIFSQSAFPLSLTFRMKNSTISFKMWWISFYLMIALKLAR